MTTLEPSPVDRSSEPLGLAIEHLHRRIREELPAVERVAAALYDPESGALQTFVHSTDGPTPLLRYEKLLSQVPSLERLADSREPRVLGDLTVLSGSPSEHTRKLLERGYRSSYTVPFYEPGALRGFLFFDARETDFFGPDVLRRLSLYADLLTSVLLRSLEHVRLLRSALHILATVSRFRDAETAEHLRRVSLYARLIARSLPPDELTDERTELLFLFSPAHDIGKIAIPDAVLFKPGRLTSAETAVMRTHVVKGVALVDHILLDNGMREMPHVAMLRSIVRHHHERVDGTGYPDGLAGDQIPLEARIVSVADNLDALVSPRPYKEPWSPQRVLDHLAAERSRQFDPRCVDALLSRSDELPRLAAARS